MRKFTSLMVVNLLLGSAACGSSEDDDKESCSTQETRDGGSNSNVPTGSMVDAGVDAGAVATPDASSAVDAATVTPSTQCAQVLSTASTACGGADTYEPNEKQSAAIMLDTSGGCAVVAGRLSSHSDMDWYQFISPKSDPVRVQVAYETSPTSGAELTFELHDFSSNNTLLYASGREDVKRTLTNAVVIKRNLAYQLLVSDRSQLDGCQGYNLKIDPTFCTDAFEDNDDRDSAAKGIALGTAQPATIFAQDDDWYDISGLDVAGANCTLTGEFAVNATENVDFTTFGPGSVNSKLYARISATTPSTELKLPAGGGNTLLKVESGTATCTPYTVSCKPL